MIVKLFNNAETFYKEVEIPSIADPPLNMSGKGNNCIPQANLIICDGKYFHNFHDEYSEFSSDREFIEIKDIFEVKS